ncbi:MAG: 50S ribosomal protein L21 [Bacteroidota bacterium]
MYAIVEIAGQQLKVSKDQYHYVNKLTDEIGAALTFDKVLLVDDNGSITVGAPTVRGASVSVRVLEHVKAEKVLVFKKKRRKGYRKKNGHRQQYTKVLIEAINA